ncbi:MAG: VWA domain-containing protein [Vicinamibacterales bacterium]
MPSARSATLWRVTTGFAFEQLLASDAVFFFPVTARGVDAIVRAWLPFLVDGGTTMTLTATDPVMATSADLAYATGTFAYRNPVDGGRAGGGALQTGDYLAVWRLVDGRWKMSALSAGAVPGNLLVEVGGSASPRPLAPVVSNDIRLTILAPEANSYLSGLTPLRARIEPSNAASAVTFFVDGRQVCAMTTTPFECQWDAGRTVIEHQVRVVATLSAGGRLARTVRTKGVENAENVDVDVVQMAVTVPDGRGAFVRGLPESAFHVFEDGRPQKLSHFVSQNVPLELVVAVDISASMAQSMPTLKTAVGRFLGAVPPENRVTLIGFNEAVFTLTRRATNQADRARAVERLAPWGTTALYDAILRGVELLGPETGRKALVVFSDGEDQGSYATLADVERGLQSSDVALYMIGQGRGVTAVALRKVMERIAAPTGGRALFTDSIDTLQDAFGQLLDELSNQYFLSYPPPPDARRNGAWRSISVKVDGQTDVRARLGYRAAANR